MCLAHAFAAAPPWRKAPQRSAPLTTCGACGDRLALDPPPRGRRLCAACARLARRLHDPSDIFKEDPR